ncbi:MAG TPA: hypothetical protein EYP82_07080 [Hydrogenothermaceae bacterium]|nr:hypothetical protein [Hydrogenothermaceae bacterium]
MGRKFLVIYLLICFLFSLSISKEILIENKGNYILLKNIPETKSNHKKTKSYRKYKKQKRKQHKYFVDKKNGKIFHKPDCKFAKKIKHKVKFKSKKQARNAGLRPCKVCKP